MPTVTKILDVRVEPQDLSTTLVVPHSQGTLLKSTIGSSSPIRVKNIFELSYAIGDDTSPELYYLAKSYKPGNLLPRGKCRKVYGHLIEL